MHATEAHTCYTYLAYPSGARKGRVAIETVLGEYRLLKSNRSVSYRQLLEERGEKQRPKFHHKYIHATRIHSFAGGAQVVAEWVSNNTNTYIHTMARRFLSDH